MTSHIIKPGNGISFFSFSVNTNREHSVFCKELPSSIDSLRLNPGLVSYEQYLTWGSSDILIAAISDSNDELLKFHHIPPMFDTHNFQSNYGMIISIVGNINPDISLASLSGSFPLIGYSGVKIKSHIWKYLFSNNIDYIDWISGVIKQSASLACSKEGASINDIVIISALGYGTDDLVLLAFSRSYRLIKRFILYLRCSDYSILPKYIDIGSTIFHGEHLRHIIESTFTNFGIYFGNNGCDLLSKSFDFSYANDSVYVAMGVEEKPGHLDSILKTTETIFPILSYRKTIAGRNDALLYSSSPVQLKDFLYTYYTTFFDYLQKVECPIISCETSFLFDFAKPIECDRDCSFPSTYDKSSLLDKVDKIKYACTNFHIPDHCAQALIHLLNTISYLDTNRYVALDFHHMASYFSFVIDVLYAYAINNHMDRGPNFYLEFLNDFTNWLIYFQMAYKDRFRGIPPKGEMSAFPALTNSSSCHKYLAFSDEFVNTMIFDSVHYINSYLSPTINIPNIMCISFIGNSSHPSMHSCLTLSSAFLNYPHDPLLHYECYTYLIHEIGHPLFSIIQKLYPHIKDKYYSIGNKFVKKLKRYYMDDLDECFAEFYSLVLLLPQKPVYYKDHKEDLYSDIDKYKNVGVEIHKILGDTERSIIIYERYIDDTLKTLYIDMIEGNKVSVIKDLNRVFLSIIEFRNEGDSSMRYNNVLEIFRKYISGERIDFRKEFWKLWSIVYPNIVKVGA